MDGGISRVRGRGQVRVEVSVGQVDKSLQHGSRRCVYEENRKSSTTLEVSDGPRDNNYKYTYSYDESGCIRCGNDIQEGAEQCDGTDLAGHSCQDFGFVDPGGLVCTPGCLLDPSACTPLCGNGEVEPQEGCDDANTQGGDGCSGACQVEDHWQCNGEPSQCECASIWFGENCDTCAVFVNNDPSIGQRDGLSWASAFATVQEGIGLASSFGCEVWVAQGTYHIYQTSNSDTVSLVNQAAIYGGFTGVETERSQRDWESYPTILDGQDLFGFSHVHSVLTAVTVQDATVDGFTIRGGMGGQSGGGIYCRNSSVTVANCVVMDNLALEGAGMYNWGCTVAVTNNAFIDNTSSEDGGGMFNRNSSVTVTDSVFDGNRADDGAGMENLHCSSVAVTDCSLVNNYAGNRGGGIHSFNVSSITVTRCSFVGNDAAGASGGGMNTSNSSLEVTDTVLADNWASDDGGGMFIGSSSSWITNCVFLDNRASDNGGGIYNWNNSSPVVTNCTFADNSGNHGGGAMYNRNFSSPTLTNCVLWSNSPNAIENRTESTPTVTYSDVQGGHVGAGNINANPMFVDLAGGNLELQQSSLCIDAANGDVAPTADIAGIPRHDDSGTTNTGVGSPPYVDMGAYEYHP